MTPDEARRLQTPPVRHIELPPAPFMTNPTSCPTGSVATDIEADLWEEPGNFLKTSISSDMNGIPYQIEGCERLGFQPRASIKSATQRAASPTV